MKLCFSAELWKTESKSLFLSQKPEFIDIKHKKML